MSASPASRAQPGLRGRRTRARLMAAAREMLKSASPIELTAIAVSRAAGTAPPSFYVYFADTRDLLLALAEEASEDLVQLAALLTRLPPPVDRGAWAESFVARFVDVWNAHAEVLAIRNLEADRGDAAFDDSRVASSLPVLTALTELMLAARPQQRRVEAFAEAVIFYATLERIAGIEHSTRPSRLQPHHYKAAIARMLAAAVSGPEA